MKVLVLGATGAVGGAIAAELERRGHDVVRLSRSASGSGTVAGDATDPGVLLEAAAGCDVIASAVGPRQGSGDDDSATIAGTARAVLAAAALGGARRSIQDYAAAFADEVDRPRARRARICVAY